MTRRKTLTDVSVASGVSLITVSRALRHPHTVQKSTREKIYGAIKEIGYVPNLTARSLVSNRSDMVGVVVPILSSSLFSDLAQGIASVLTGEKLQMLLAVSERSTVLEEEAVKTFVGRQADAIIVTGFTHSASCRTILSDFAGPVVETWNIGGDVIDLAVGYDNFQASADMTTYLIGRGYRRIAVIGGEFQNNDQSLDRLRGFQHAMSAAGLPIRQEFVLAVPNPTTMEDGREALTRMLSLSDPPDAIFFHAELPAIGAMMACMERGIAVPGDIAIAGFGDLSLSSLLPVPLTTVRVKAREIGERSARLVLDKLRGNLAADTKQVDVGYEIIARKSA